MKYRFLDYELDTDDFVLTRDSVAVSVEPQVFDLIRMLVENHGRLVTRDEILERVWSGRIVSDAALSSRINAARQCVGDDGTSQKVIRTVPRRGFRFVAPVEALPAVARDEPGDSTPSPETPAAFTKPTIAVLPFENMSRDPEQEFFGDGMTEEIITSLSKIEEMFVIDRRSSFVYKGRPTKVQEVARELGVRYVVEGAVRTAGSRMRVTAQLIDAVTGHHLWADRHDRDLDDIFDLQDEITQEVVTALQVRLTEGEGARLRRRQTNDVEAWERFTRAQTVMRRFNKEDNLVARALLEEALELDPDFAVAWAMLGWTHLVDARLGWGVSAPVSLAQGVALCERSLDLDDTGPDAYSTLGAMQLFQRRYEEAEENGRKAVELGPNVADALVWLATTLNYTGRAPEALGLIEKAMRFCPFYPDWYLGILGVCYRGLGRLEEAIRVDLERLARNPENTLSNFRLAAVYSELGRHEEAAAQVTAYARKNPQASLRQVRMSEPYRDPKEMERYLDALRRAGLPE